MDNLLNYSLAKNPLDSFAKWFEEAEKVEQNAAAMSVATYDHEHNRPMSRYILCKGIKDGKIVFYTNYLSSKSKDLNHNPEVALNFYWHESKKQVRIQGKVAKMSALDSEKYFHSRDRDSQIASSISTQSAPIADKAELIKKFESAKKQFDNIEVPLPENWGGYLVDPYEFEFFLYGENRLNDRFLYVLKNGQWDITRLQP
ncbi:MAG: pyridoxamine 5'-phosphate oxidase [Bacteriovorax sp.]